MALYLGSSKIASLHLGQAEQRSYEEGKQAEHKRFMGAYQQNGNRESYSYAYFGSCWTNEILTPIFDITPTGACSSMFQQCGFVGDLAQHFIDCCILFDLSRATSLASCFNSATGITRLPVINITGAGANAGSIFAYYKGTTIDKFVVNENNTFAFSFQSATNLQNIVIEGTIANDFDIRWSPLSHDSLMSILYALKDFTGTGTTRVLTLGATNLAKLTDAEKAIATQKGWTLA